MKYYLAYGSNLNLTQMFHRCPDAQVLGYTYLPGRHLVFRGSGSGNYLTLDKGIDQVPCGVFAISARDEHSLDRYEGFPMFYKKEIVRVDQVWDHYYRQPDPDLRNLEAMVYVMAEGHPLGGPTATYWRTCVQGYRDFSFDQQILKRALIDSRAGENNNRT